MKGKALYTVLFFVGFMPLLAKCQTGLKANTYQKLVFTKKGKKSKRQGTFNIGDQDKTIPVGAVTIEVYNNGTLIGSSLTGANGYSGIINVPPGQFEVKALKAGYDTLSFDGVTIAAGKISYVEMERKPVSDKKSK